MNIWPATVLAIEIELPLGFTGFYHKTYTPHFSRFLLDLVHLRIVIKREGQHRQIIFAEDFFERVDSSIKWSIDIIWEEKVPQELSGIYSFILYYEDETPHRRREI